MGRIITSEQAKEMRSKSKGRLGKIDPTKAALEHTTIRDIAWAAGIFEGEGCSSRATGCDSQFAGVTQKDPWLVHRLHAIFGGSVRKTFRKEAWRGDGKPSEYWHWSLSGARCRGFLMTIYSFLSPRRQEQAKWTLGLQTKEQYLQAIST